MSEITVGCPVFLGPGDTWKLFGSMYQSPDGFIEEVKNCSVKIGIQGRSMYRYVIEVPMEKLKRRNRFEFLKMGSYAD